MTNDYGLTDPPNRSETGTMVKWILWGLFIVVLISSLAGCIGWVAGWIALPGRIVNPDDTLARWRWYYDTYQGEQGLGATIRQAEKSLEEFKQTNGDPQFWNFSQQGEYDRLVAVRDGYISQYNRVAQQYNAQMRDITRNYIRPGDLPACISNWGENECLE